MNYLAAVFTNWARRVRPDSASAERGSLPKGLSNPLYYCEPASLGAVASTQKNRRGKFQPLVQRLTAAKLAPQRDDGVMILGSGNIVHNLRYFRGVHERFVWANCLGQPLQQCCRRKLREGGHAALIDYLSLDQEAQLSVPTNEHYLPLLYVLAAQKQKKDA
nr:MAG: hypothetical protein E4H34_00225 [Hyphomicrobiales bacterium]